MVVTDGAPSSLGLLVWTAGTGGGHRGVAAAITQAASALPGLAGRVKTSEPLERASPALRRVLSAYGPLVRYAPLAWGGLFHLTQGHGVRSALEAGLGRLLVPVLRAELIREQPQAVVVLHPLLVASAVAARRALPATVSRPAIVVLVTDLAGGHPSWVDPAVDRTLTASVAASRWARSLGAPPDRITLVGLPVHPALADPAPDAADRRALRISLGLDPELFCVLLSGGAEGAGPIASAAACLLRSNLPLQLAVICGRNHILAQRLRRWRAPRPMRIAEFVEDVPSWLRSADVVVGKAGPSSVAEAAAAGLPVLVTSALPGQERPNVALIEEEGFGASVPVRRLAEVVASLAAPGSARYQAMAAAARRWGRPRAAVTVAGLLAELALPPGRPRNGSAPPGGGRTPG
ncbi:MAG TPA: glycosyltransferase [Verrucomicrobiae bacterium]|nr:glycosyltransferase [Verrucomicrobiae bacterium]